MTTLYTLPDGREVPAGTAFSAYVTLKPGPPPVRDMVQYPSNWLSNATPADLARVGITTRDVDPPPPTIAELVAYADAKINAIREAGVTINGVKVETTIKGMTLLGGSVQRAKENPEAICNWTVSPDEEIDLDAPTVIALGLAVGDWINAGYAALRAVYAAIKAGTITTYEDVDAAAWPPATI